MMSKLVTLVIIFVVVVFLGFNSTAEQQQQESFRTQHTDADKQAREADELERRGKYGGGGHNTGFNIAYLDHMIRAIPSNSLPEFMSNPLSKQDWTHQVEGAPRSDSRFHAAHSLL